MVKSERPESDKGNTPPEKTKLESLRKRCKRKSRCQIDRESEEVWRASECDLLCSKKNRNNSKKKELRYQERNRQERIKYLRALRELIEIYGSKSLVFIDESGFEEIQACIYGWSKRGKKIYGEKQGKRGKRENLVAGRRKKEKDLIAPMLFTGRLDAVAFEGWLEKYLLPSLNIPSVLIMDNAPIHRKSVIRECVEEAGHQVLFLPKYSPDFNDIEHDFSALKRARMYAPIGTSLDEIIRNYCAA